MCGKFQLNGIPHEVFLKPEQAVPDPGRAGSKVTRGPLVSHRRRAGNTGTLSRHRLLLCLRGANTSLPVEHVASLLGSVSPRRRKRPPRDCAGGSSSAQAARAPVRLLQPQGGRLGHGVPELGRMARVPGQRGQGQALGRDLLTAKAAGGREDAPSCPHTRLGQDHDRCHHKGRPLVRTPPAHTQGGGSALLH